MTAPGMDPEARSHLARLCRGFLLAREEDPRRAEAFLVTFLSELDRAVPRVGPGPSGLRGA